MMFFGAGANAPAPMVSTAGKRNVKPHAKFTHEDDELLKMLVAQFGENDWSTIAANMPGRNVRQCKERWMYYLNPHLNTTPWTREEDMLLLEKQREFGSKWVKIAMFFPHRTDAMVKNRFQVLNRKMTKEFEMRMKTQQIMRMPWLFQKVYPRHPAAAKRAAVIPAQQVPAPAPEPEDPPVVFPIDEFGPIWEDCECFDLVF